MKSLSGSRGHCYASVSTHLALDSWKRHCNHTGPASSGTSSSVRTARHADFRADHPVDSLLPLITLHNHHLTTLTILSQTILAPETSFDLAKLTLERWRDLSMGGERYEGVKEWEELVFLETTMGAVEVEKEEEVATPGAKGRKKGRR